MGGQSVPDLEPDALYALRRRCGMLFQFGALFTDMSVFENIAFPMREHTELPEEIFLDTDFQYLFALRERRERVGVRRNGQISDIGFRVPPSKQSLCCRHDHPCP